jgi:hypothetical protein
VSVASTQRLEVADALRLLQEAEGIALVRNPDILLVVGRKLELIPVAPFIEPPSAADQFKGTGHDVIDSESKGLQDHLERG